MLQGIHASSIATSPKEHIIPALENEYIDDAMSAKDLEIVRAEQAKEEFFTDKKTRVFSWTVLIILLLAQISNQW